MDQYLMLVETLCKAMTKKDEEIRHTASDLIFIKNDYNAHVRLKKDIDKTLDTKETQKEILINYNEIISNLKKKFALKVSLKTLAMLVVTVIGVAVASSVPGINTIIYVISLLLEAAMVSGEIGHYQMQVESYHQLHESATIEALEQEISQLREASCGLEKTIEGFAKKVAAIEELLNSLKYDKAKLFGQYNGIIQKRTALFEQNRQISEEELNEKYLGDEEVLKLERKLKNGENI